MAAAVTQVARYYDLPIYVKVGFSDSKCLDAQSGIERGMAFLMGAMAGADLISFHVETCTHLQRTIEYIKYQKSRPGRHSTLQIP